MATEQDMIAAWKAAARELGLDVRSPFELDGIEYPALVANFGSVHGTLPLLLGDQRRFDHALRAGYFASLLNPESYGAFNRKLFEETLNDWQWFGQNSPPPWYTGEAWG